MSASPDGPVAPQPVAAQRPFLLWRSFTRFLYNQNPFYLLSVACVLHSTRFWYRDPHGVYDPWPLMAIICGYIALLAATGFVLVRLGRVWDDARSILLTLLLLFVELSLTFDGILIVARPLGATLLVIGWLVSVVISEGMLLGLGIRLPAVYRVPYHLFLALLFFYPLLIVSSYGDRGQTAQWRIYLFSAVAAVVLLTLLPAVRRGSRAVRDNGTPWPWPLYPWSIFFVLGVCVALRAYALSLSFDPVLSQDLTQAMRLDTAFGGYFLVPLLLAAGLLLLEAGIVTGRPGVRHAALCVPAVCLVLSLPGYSGAPPYDEFLTRFTARAGSPFWLAAVCGSLYCAWARFRGIREAELPAIVALLLALTLERKNAADPTLVQLADSWQWLLAAGGMWLGLRRHDPRAWLAGVAGLLLVVRTTWLGEAGWLMRDMIPGHLALVGALVIAFVFDTPFARALRHWVTALLGAAALAACVVPLGLTLQVSEAQRLSYALAMSSASLACAIFGGGGWPLVFGSLGLAGAAGRVLLDTAQFLERVWRWTGAGYFLLGLVWFGIAVLISAAKAGFQLRQSRPRADRVDGG